MPNHPLRAAALAATVWLVALPAEACGGLFCSRVPVDQAGEKILFVQDGGNVTAHVQIQYQGDAKDFSWIVPVPTEPTLGVGSDALFTNLRNVTRPTFTLNLTTNGDCAQPKGGMLTSSGVARSAPTSATGVSVLQQSQVGPFDSVVLKSDDPGALKKWLTDNSYVIPAGVDPLLDPYVAGKYDFVALKLSKTSSVGDIRPIVLTYKATKPGIPIRLTSVAATPNMAVYVWVLGEHRAIPENYRHAVIDEARIDWLNAGQNYSQVVTAAMNEAGGQAFVTDYAGDSQPVAMDAFDTSRFKLDAVRAAATPAAFANAVRQQGYFDQLATSTGFPGAAVAPDARYVDFLKKYVTKPDSLKDVDDQQFYANLDAYQQQLDEAQVTVDTAKAAQELQDSVVKPLDDIKAAFAKHPYLTGLFTTMSPEQMTQDPTFLFNPDLPKVTAQHQAKGVVACNGAVTYGEAPILITLGNGTSYYAQRSVTGNSAPLKLPAAARIEQLKPQGAAAVITENRGTIDAVLGGAAAGAVAIDPSTGSTVSVSRTGGSGGFGCSGCAAVNPPAAQPNRVSEGFAYAAMIVGWLGFRRRLRRRKR